MLDPELAAKLDEIEHIAQAAYVAAEKSRKYLFWTGVVTIAVIVLPLIGLVFVIPQFINTYTSTYSAVLNNQPIPQKTQQQESSTLQLLNSLGI